MTVNFTGIKNVGAMFITTPEMGRTVHIMSMQLTNDESGNDLDEFTKAIEKTGKSERYTSPYEGTLNIGVATKEEEEEYIPATHQYFINGKQLKVNDKNLAVFSYLCKLSGKIQNKKKEELGGSIDYIKSPDFINGSSIAHFLKQAFLANPNADLFPLLNNMYRPSVAKAGAEIVRSAIDETMTDYFA